MRNDGKDAESGFLDIIQRHGGIFERFWDQADLRGRNGGRAVGDFPKPADFIITLFGVVSFAEVKSTVKGKSFAFGGIQPGQSSCALRQAVVGGAYNFYIYSYELERWFVMPCAQYAAIKNAGRASVKFEELQPWPLSLT